MMRMSRERLFHLTDLILKELGTTQGVSIKAPDELRTEVLRALTEEAKLAESIDGEVRKIFEQLPRPMPEGSHEWKCLTRRPARSVPQEVPSLKDSSSGSRARPDRSTDSSARDPARAGRRADAPGDLGAGQAHDRHEETAFTVRDVEALAAHHYDIRDIGASIASGPSGRPGW
jgi:hypothetical protein